MNTPHLDFLTTGFRAAVSRPAVRAIATVTAVWLVAAEPTRGQPPAPAAASAPDAAREAAAAAIRAATRTYREALDRGDGKTLAALWTPDGDIVDDEGRVLNGRQTVGEIAPATADTPRPTFRIEETKLRFVSADVAIEDGTVEVTPPGTTAALSGWFSATWVKHEGSWKLTALRESRISAPHDAPQLADLDWMVGDWTVAEAAPNGDAAAAAPAQAPAVKTPLEMSVRWNDTRTFLLRDLKVTSPGTPGGEPQNGPPTLQLTQRIGWDPLSRQIVSWSFGSDGSHGEGIWTRDPTAEGTTWIARTMAVMPDGTQTSSLTIYTYDGADRCTWRSVPTHVGGEHTPHVVMTMIRKPPAAPQRNTPQGSKTR
ncbi:MAG: nuclear transport factor 2 family protein [Planctomycetia bacterium]